MYVEYKRKKVQLLPDDTIKRPGFISQENGLIIRVSIDTLVFSDGYFSKEHVN